MRRRPSCAHCAVRFEVARSPQMAATSRLRGTASRYLPLSFCPLPSQRESKQPPFIHHVPLLFFIPLSILPPSDQVRVKATTATMTPKKHGNRFRECGVCVDHHPGPKHTSSQRPSGSPRNVFVFVPAGRRCHFYVRCATLLYSTRIQGMITRRRALIHASNTDMYIHVYSTHTYTHTYTYTYTV